MTVRTQNGSIAVSHPTEFLELHTENGSIDITNAVSDIRARSANGAIELSVDADRTPSLQIFASNGAITVSVGAAFTGEIDLVADNGSIQLEDEAGKVTAEVLRDDGSRHLVIGGGVNKSTLRSGNGSVRFTILPGPRVVILENDHGKTSHCSSEAHGGHSDGGWPEVRMPIHGGAGGAWCQWWSRFNSHVACDAGAV